MKEKIRTSFSCTPGKGRPSLSKNLLRSEEERIIYLETYWSRYIVHVSSKRAIHVQSAIETTSLQFLLNIYAMSTPMQHSIQSDPIKGKAKSIQAKELNKLTGFLRIPHQPNIHAMPTPMQHSMRSDSIQGKAKSS
jgi:hypothetical protein